MWLITFKPGYIYYKTIHYSESGTDTKTVTPFQNAVCSMWLSDYNNIIAVLYALLTLV